MMKKPRIEMIVAISSLLGWIGIGTVLFHRLESWTWIQSFYFSVVTISTVGYGDLAPTNDGSRFFTAIYILVGVSIGIAALGLIGSGVIKNRERRYVERRK
jgi:hypothetical protein